MIEFLPPTGATFARRPAVFVDRDGVLIANRDRYVRSVADIEVIDGALVAVRHLVDYGFHVVVVSNQAGVGRGRMTERDARDVHEEVMALFRAGSANLSASFLCPHAPAEDCRCRKPRPGLILRAVERLDIDLAGSHLVGDALSDVEAGHAVGVRTHLVLTGRGTDQAALPQFPAIRPHHVHAHIAAAARLITQDGQGLV